MATLVNDLDRVKRIWCLLPMRAAKVQASLRIRAVSPEPPLLAHRSSESRGTLRQKARSLAPLNGWARAVKVCHDGMLEDTNSLDGAHFIYDESATDAEIEASEHEELESVELILCESDSCAVGWFHYECAGLTQGIVFRK